MAWARRQQFHRLVGRSDKIAVDIEFRIRRFRLYAYADKHRRQINLQFMLLVRPDLQVRPVRVVALPEQCELVLPARRQGNFKRCKTLEFAAHGYACAGWRRLDENQPIGGLKSDRRQA